MHVLTAATDATTINKFAGAKGGNLYQLTTRGIDIPPWAIIGSDVFHRFLTKNNIALELNRLLEDIRPATVAAAAAKAEELIAVGELDDEIGGVIRTAYEHVGGTDVAVRSSGAEEDGSCFSFAGQFATFLNVRGLESVAARVKDCWASAFSARSLHYRLQHRLALRDAGLAVVVQQMIPAAKSGVLFTVNPATGRTDEMLISSVFGLGEGLVSGAVDADTIVVDRKSRATRSVVGDKRERYEPRAAGQGVVVSPLPEDERGQLSLDSDEITRLAAVADQIEEIFQAAQDVEWALTGERLWILQSRPVTAIAAAQRVAPDGQLRVWDNSNIIESFSGITSPLTYSFARHAYKRVYEQYAKVLRVPEEQLEQMQEWLPYLLGYFHGRVYYNLLNWYKIAGLVPLYRLNRRVLELALGVQEPLADALADTIRPYSFRSRWAERRIRVIMSAVFILRFIMINRRVRRFLRDFAAVYQEFDGADYDRLPADEICSRFHRMERALLARWGPTMVLDAAIGLSFGALQRLTRRWLPDAPGWYDWAAVSPGRDIESVEPARRLSRLVDSARSDHGSEQVIKETPAAQAYEALKASGHEELVRQIDAYIRDFGYRSLDELKLEVPDLREDPSSLFVMLRDAFADSPAVPVGGGDAASVYLREHLRGPRRVVYGVLRRRVQAFLASRERLRFCRTRAFGMAKRMLRGMGRELASMGAIDDWGDVFYLHLDEVLGCVEGTIAHGELKQLIDLRKAHEAQSRQLDPPPRFETYGAVYWRGNLERAGWTTVRNVSAGPRPVLLRGTPSCPGRVEGEVKVLDAPSEVNGAVLVTYRTDPGWVPALPSASALVIERGSPLTHVAIVARELGVPTVVQIKDVTRHLQTGMRVRVDGGAGTVEILATPKEATR